MPLPPALAAKLSKRGLLSVVNSKGSEKKKKEFKGVSGCPNKSNIYHECTHWCEVHWKGVSTPDPKYLRNVAKLTQKYPLPQNWMEVFDKGLGKYYYWDLETDLVSWLPPKHPKANPTESAASLREKLQGGNITETRPTYKSDKDIDKDQEKKRDKKEKDRTDRKDKDRDHDTEKIRKEKYEEKERKRKTRREENLDPMDPAAYSDCPVGTWSDGLETNKSGADSTASGAVYQQRPYPAPGEVLASNKVKKKKE